MSPSPAQPVQFDRLAYAVARRAAGLDKKKPDLRSCWRCDVVFNGFCSYLAGTPCKDCRQFLKEIDGETTVWKGNPTLRAVRTFA